MSEEAKEFFELRAKNSSFSDSQATHIGKPVVNVPRPYRWIASSMLLMGDDFLLDAGCGTGQFLHDAEDLVSPSKTVGFDASIHMIKRAKKSSLSS